MTVLTPEFLQTKKYSALRDRLALAHGGPIQAGVWGATDFFPSAPGSGMSINSGAGAALVTGGAGGDLYHVINDASVNITVPASNGTNPRIDQLILHVYDATDLGSAQDAGILEVLPGTATAGATLANRTGAAALPSGSIRLADILVPAASASVTSANIRDRRPWARGVLANRSTTSTIALTSTLASVGLPIRVECSGVPIKVTLSSSSMAMSAAGNYGIFTAFFDGVEGLPRKGLANMPTAGYRFPLELAWINTPSAGSHLIDVYAAISSTGGSIGDNPSGGGVNAGAGFTEVTIEELPRPNAYNGTS